MKSLNASKSLVPVFQHVGRFVLYRPIPGMRTSMEVATNAGIYSGAFWRQYIGVFCPKVYYKLLRLDKPLAVHRTNSLNNVLP